LIGPIACRPEKCPNAGTIAQQAPQVSARSVYLPDSPPRRGWRGTRTAPSLAPEGWRRTFLNSKSSSASAWWHGGLQGAAKVAESPRRAETARAGARGGCEICPAFTHEAQALAALNHPNIVTIHDFGQAGGFYFLLMEFVDGVNLRQAMKAGRFTPEQALAVVPPVCEALQYAHEHGIVHRDIKRRTCCSTKKAG